MSINLEKKPIRIGPVKDEIRYDAIFGVRNLRQGPFKGLWELVHLDDKGNRVKVLTDANSRGMILTIINRYVMKIVVQS